MTAITMRQMMEGVVIHPGGTGRAARLEGYTALRDGLDACTARTGELKNLVLSLRHAPGRQ